VREVSLAEMIEWTGPMLGVADMASPEVLKQRNFKVKENHLKEIFIQIVEGVSYLHSLGIVHRDIKLENILMSDNSDYSKPVLIDFGLSTLLPLNKKSDEPYGTIGYCSPEIIKNEFHNNKAKISLNF
jgi:serine/threonine protein kinase